MEIISKLRHRHLVSIIGHCIVSDQENPNIASSVYLISECVTNGSLRSHLTGMVLTVNAVMHVVIYNWISAWLPTYVLTDFTEWRKREMLKWPQRVSAAIGIARGVQFLHNVTAPGIVQNNLNIEHILLDKTLTSKISDFSLPMISTSKNGKVSSKWLVKFHIACLVAKLYLFLSLRFSQRPHLLSMKIMILAGMLFMLPCGKRDASPYN